MSKTKSSQKKVSLSELNNHTTTNKRQALKDLNKLDFTNKFNFSSDEIINRAKEAIINLPNNIEGVKKNINQMGKMIDYQGVKIHPDSLNTINKGNNNLLFYIIIFLLLLLISNL